MQEQDIKIVLLGIQGSGKHTLTAQFVQGTTVEEVRLAITMWLCYFLLGYSHIVICSLILAQKVQINNNLLLTAYKVSYFKKFEVDGNTYNIEILDTGGTVCSKVVP